MIDLNRTVSLRLCKSLGITALAGLGCSLQWQTASESAVICLALLLFVLSFWSVGLQSDRRVCGWAVALGALLAVFMVVGKEIHTFESIERLIAPNEWLKTLCRLVGMTVFCWLPLKILFHYAQKQQVKIQRFRPPFMMIWLALFLCWLPYFIVFFPGCVSNDSFAEIMSMLGKLPLNNHHPLIHQWTIAPFVLLGQAIGSMEWGIALYSLFQMAAMSAIFAYALWELGNRDTALWLRIMLFAWYALHSVNAFYSISMWKDVLFGGLTLLVVMQLTAICEKKEEAKLGRWLLLGVTLFLFCIYRNNGYYAFLFGIPLFLLIQRRFWKPLLVLTAAVVLAVNAYQTLIFDVLGAQKSKPGEALSVPLQQIARTVRYYHRSVTEEEMAVLEEIFPSVEEVRWAYIPHISDPVKDLLIAETFKADPLRYVKVWAQIGMRHPLVYLDAFLYQGHGYWYPNTPYWTVYYDIFENELGVKMEPTAAVKALRKLHDRFENGRVIGYLYRPGTYVWLMLIACGGLLCKWRGKLLAPLLVLLGIWLTTLLSPVFSEYRYLYGVIVSVPYVLGLAQSAQNPRN